MANQFGKVSVGITATTGGLTAGLQNASKQLKGFGANVSAIRGQLTTLVAIQGAQLFGSIARGVFNAARSLVAMGQAAAQTIDSTSKMARTLGMTYGELAGLSLAADLAGVSMGQVGVATVKADVLMTKAANGSKAAQEAFERLGLNIAQLQGMSGADRFEAIASAIAALPTAAERAAAAVAIFGRSGAQLMPLFEGGADAIRQAREEAQRFGLALTNRQGQEVEAMNDSFTRVQSAIRGVVSQVVAYLAPAIKTVTTTFSDFVGTVGGANIGQAIGAALLDAAIYLAGVGDYLIANIGPIFKTAFENGSAVATAFYRTAEFLRGVFNAIQLGFQTIILAFTGLLEIAASAFGGIDGLSEYNQGLMQRMSQNAQEMQQAFGNAFGFEQGTELGQAAATPLTDMLTKARDAAREAAAAIDDTVKPAIKAEVAGTIDISSQSLKAIVAGSSEGEAFRNAILRGNDPRLVSDTDRQVANNTARTVDAVEDLGDQFSGILSQISVASITV